MNAANQLMEITIEIKDLVERAFEIVKEEAPQHVEEAKAYWYAQILTKLDEKHGYFSSSICTMEDTIKKINEDNRVVRVERKLRKI